MADIRLPIPWHNGGKALSAQWQVLQKFCSAKMNDSPFHLMAGLLKVFTTGQLCPLLQGLH